LAMGLVQSIELASVDRCRFVFTGHAIVQSTH
jgi:hypothetical protein